MNIKWQDYITNNNVLERANLPSIETILMFHQLCWVGHVSHMDNSRMPNAVLYGNLCQGKNDGSSPQAIWGSADIGWHQLPESGTIGRQQRVLALNIKENCCYVRRYSLSYVLLPKLSRGPASHILSSVCTAVHNCSSLGSFSSQQLGGMLREITWLIWL